MTGQPTMAPALATVLERPIGRGTIVDQATAAQLLPKDGPLTRQLTQFFQATAGELRKIFAQPPEKYTSNFPDWALLTEHEHPTWPLLALSRPPALPSDLTAQMVRQLASHPVLLSPERCRTLAQTTSAQPELAAFEGQALTWGQVLALLVTARAYQAALPLWGVLSAHIGLHTSYRREAAADLWQELCLTPPTVGLDAPMLAQAAAWAALRPLHGGLKFSEAGQHLFALLHELQTLPTRTTSSPLPSRAGVAEAFAAQFPALQSPAFPEEAETLAQSFWQQLHHPQDNIFGETPQTGLLLLREPGRVVYWLRRAGSVQLVAAQVGQAVSVQSWVWTIPRAEAQSALQSAVQSATGNGEL